MSDSLKEKMIERIESMEYSEIFEFLSICLDQVIEDKIESMTNEEMIKVL